MLIGFVSECPFAFIEPVLSRPLSSLSRRYKAAVDTKVWASEKLNCDYSFSCTILICYTMGLYKKINAEIKVEFDFCWITFLYFLKIFKYVLGYFLIVFKLQLLLVLYTNIQKFLITGKQKGRTVSFDKNWWILLQLFGNKSQHEFKDLQYSIIENMKTIVMWLFFQLIV